jgi:hypothetical protein
MPLYADAKIVGRQDLSVVTYCNSYIWVEKWKASQFGPARRLIPVISMAFDVHRLHAILRVMSNRGVTLSAMCQVLLLVI